MLIEEYPQVKPKVFVGNYFLNSNCGRLPSNASHGYPFQVKDRHMREQLHKKSKLP